MVFVYESLSLSRIETALKIFVKISEGLTQMVYPLPLRLFQMVCPHDDVHHTQGYWSWT